MAVDTASQFVNVQWSDQSTDLIVLRDLSIKKVGSDDELIGDATVTARIFGPVPVDDEPVIDEAITIEAHASETGTFVAQKPHNIDMDLNKRYTLAVTAVYESQQLTWNLTLPAKKLGSRS